MCRLCEAATGLRLTPLPPELPPRVRPAITPPCIERVSIKRAIDRARGKTPSEGIHSKHRGKYFPNSWRREARRTARARDANQERGSSRKNRDEVFEPRERRSAQRRETLLATARLDRARGRWYGSHLFFPDVGDRREAHIPAAQQTPQAHPWFQEAHALARRAAGAERASSQGAQETDRRRREEVAGAPARIRSSHGQ